MTSAISRVLAVASSAALLLASTPAWSASGALGTGDVCTLRTVERSAASTQSCLTCHDGTVAGVHGAIGGGEHPIDVSYDAAAATNLRLRTRFELSRRLVLPAGQLTCVTCHDGASSEPKHTALTMSQSALCTSCHAI
jgi:predicted CXXCH cytochrome family protein